MTAIRRKNAASCHVCLQSPGRRTRDETCNSTVPGVPIVSIENKLPGQGHPPATNCFQ
jgi:hypothetical protein